MMFYGPAVTECFEYFKRCNKMMSGKAFILNILLKLSYANNMNEYDCEYE